ncbi:Bug family tripartite tricarboxylate transporter substrate binding protein [Verminephrobacter eiseniae]|uniref:Bug family tripartite tricarboxylate transporter substrate binding protein n=1 Tax=Verminephrobacter eiseniae TaxID=364317 RepID=UPI002237EEF1|nr:tripartite tricarboxylate transporter substrate binding protein [Verminephrobacter eiseniae]MCW5237148.1 tripartite tricarboxylate transporter substrate binding protein [Verminephrobacter eiseniae]
MNRRDIFLAGLAFASAATALPAWADTYPDKPVKLIVPYAPGGTTDILARVIATRLQIELKQPFVVDNRPGAGGAVGSAHAAKQLADGYTLVMVVESSHAVNPNVYQKTAYDPVKDFAPISNIADVPNVLVVNPRFPAQDLKGMIAQLKANPAKYSFDSSGNGGLSHLNGEIFKHVTGTDLLHIPYRGLGPALSDLIAGQIDVVFDNIPSSAGMLQAGQTRALAVAAKSRLKLLPQVPTYAELGLPQLNTPSWFGIGAPAGTPAPVLDTLNKAVRAALANPEVVAAIEKQGAIPSPMSRAEFSDLIVRENARWKKVVQDIGFEKM